MLLILGIFMKRVIFVCLGNICRSPSGEAVFNKIVESNSKEDNFYVDSAGTSAYHAGEKADTRMISHGVKRGYNFISRSRQFIRDDFNNFDIIIAMDSSNYKDILGLDSGNKYKSKVFMMTDFSTNFKGQDVPDPYYGGADGFEIVLDILEDSCLGLYKYLNE